MHTAQFETSFGFGFLYEDKKTKKLLNFPLVQVRIQHQFWGNAEILKNPEI